MMSKGAIAYAPFITCNGEPSSKIEPYLRIEALNVLLHMLYFRSIMCK